MIGWLFAIWWGVLPGDFHSSADLACPTGLVGCRVTVPDWVYRVQSPQGSGQEWAPYSRDGQELPWRLLEAPVPVPETLAVWLPFFPLANAAKDAPDRLALHEVEGRLVLHVEDASRPGLVPTDRWLVDVRGRHLAGLTLVAQGGFFGELDVEASADLVHWTSWSHGQAVARLDSAGFTVRQLVVPLEDSTAFLRLHYRAQQGQLVLQGVRGQVQNLRTVPRDSWRPEVAMQATDSGWSWDLGGAFPISGAFVALASDGAWGEIALEARHHPGEAWQPVTTQTCFHWSLGGHTFFQDTLNWQSAQRYRYWRVRPLGAKATLGTNPRLLVRMRPDRVELATGGAAELVWAAGLESQRLGASQALTRELPGQVGEGVIGPPRQVRGEAAWKPQTPPRKWVLWASLLGFLGILAVMAWRLWREMLGKRAGTSAGR